MHTDEERSPGTIVPAAHGWLARYTCEGEPDRVLRVIAWRVRGSDNGHLLNGSAIVAFDNTVMDAEPLTPYLSAALNDRRYDDADYAGVVHEDDR
jgi:hypothetical protein